MRRLSAVIHTGYLLQHAVPAGHLYTCKIKDPTLCSVCLPFLIYMTLKQDFNNELYSMTLYTDLRLLLHILNIIILFIPFFDKFYTTSFDLKFFEYVV